MSRAFISTVAVLSMCLLATGCASGRYRTIDQLFAADHVEKSRLDQVVEDIRDHSDGSVAVLVKYKLIEPFSGSEALAQEQADAIKAYLVSHQIKAPIQTATSPKDVTPNQIWISYQIRTGKSPAKKSP